MENLEKLQLQIVEIFSQCFEIKLPSEEVDLLDTGIVDSVRIVELVLEIEQRFGVSLPFEDLEIDDFRTVKRLAECIGRTASVAA
jgi:D-alanine--poly(phosphoribitol) ligase subunit 2